MRIKAKVLERMAKSNRIRARLSLAMDISTFTIYDWIRENNENLTKASALKVIREELNLTDDQILEETKKSVA